MGKHAPLDFLSRFADKTTLNLPLRRNRSRVNYCAVFFSLVPLSSTLPQDKMVLTQQEIDACREAFCAFDKDRSGTIDVWELRQVLEAMGQLPTEDELFALIAAVDDNMSGSIDFAEFLKVVEGQKNSAKLSNDTDMIDAFVACGGNADKTGHVMRHTLIKIIKHDFGLTVNLEELINEIDTDGSGEIEFDEFRVLLSAS